MDWQWCAIANYNGGGGLWRGGGRENTSVVRHVRTCTGVKDPVPPPWYCPGVAVLLSAWRSPGGTGVVGKV